MYDKEVFNISKVKVFDELINYLGTIIIIWLLIFCSVIVW